MKRMKSVNSLSGADLRNTRNKGKAKPKLLIQQPASEVKIYTAPSLEDGDVEYKKLISGKVDHNKPSFA